MDMFELGRGLALVGALPALILLLLLVLPRRGDAASLFRSPTDLGWPRGVQEEEPVRWRFESFERASLPKER